MNGRPFDSDGCGGGGGETVAGGLKCCRDRLLVVVEGLREGWGFRTGTVSDCAKAMGPPPVFNYLCFANGSFNWIRVGSILGRIMIASISVFKLISTCVDFGSDVDVIYLVRILRFE